MGKKKTFFIEKNQIKSKLDGKFPNPTVKSLKKTLLLSWDIFEVSPITNFFSSYVLSLCLPKQEVTAWTGSQKTSSFSSTSRYGRTVKTGMSS